MEMFGPRKGQGMMGISRAARVRRFAGAAGLALLVAAGPLAGPASAAKLASFSGMGTGFALRVTLDVRPLIQAVPALQGVLDTVWAGVPGQTGAFPGVIDQTFIKTTSDADPTVTKSRSVLAEGLVDLDAVEATSVGQNVEKVVQTVQVPSADLPVLDAKVGTLKASVASGPGVNGSGKLADVGVGLALDALPTSVATDLIAQLQAAIDEITADLTPALEELLGDTSSDALVDQVSGTITDMAETLPADSSAIGDLTTGLGLGSPAELADEAAVSDALATALDPAALVAMITDLLDASLLEGALADLTGLVNFTKAARTGDARAVADSVSQLKSLNVLGGLVSAGVLNLESHSQAAGTKGSAKNSSSCSIADVKVGGDALAISFDGSNVWVNGSPVPVVGDAVAQLKGVVDQVLATVGIEVGLCETAQVEAEADGTAAAQRVSALRVAVAPLGLFSLVIDPTVETSVAASVASKVADKPALPRTGAGAFATLLSGLGLAGAAFIGRRWLLGRSN